MKINTFGHGNLSGSNGSNGTFFRMLVGICNIRRARPDYNLSQFDIKAAIFYIILKEKKLHVFEYFFRDLDIL